MKTYNLKVLDWVMSIHEGIYSIDKFVKPQNRDNFTKAIKMIIDGAFDSVNGFTIEFNKDYTKIKKFSNKGFHYKI